MYPLADVSLHPTLGALIHIPSGRKTRSGVVDVPFGRFFAWVPLVIYPLAEKLLVDVAFGRFGASSDLGALIDCDISPLFIYLLVEKPLADVPFGRFFASSHLGA